MPYPYRDSTLDLVKVTCEPSCWLAEPAGWLAESSSNAYMPWAFTPSARIALSATSRRPARCTIAPWEPMPAVETTVRSEEHTSELQSLMRISYAVFCLKKKK